MAGKKIDLTEVFKRDQFGGVIMRLSDDQFKGLLGVLSDSVKVDVEKTVEVILAAVDTNPLSKDKEFPKGLSLKMMALARGDKIGRQAYRNLRSWYEATALEGVDLLQKIKKKKADKSKEKNNGKDNVSPKPVKKQPAPDMEVETTPDPQIASGKDPEPPLENKLTIDDLLQDMTLPEPVDTVVDVEEGEVVEKGVVEKPSVTIKNDIVQVEEKEKKEKPPLKIKPAVKPKAKPRTKKTVRRIAADNGLLSVAHHNIRIYNTTHIKEPDLFIQFDPGPYNVEFKTNPECFEMVKEGEVEPLYISRRVLDPLWKPKHPIVNPLSTKSLGPIVDFLLSRWVNYDMLLRFVDETDYTQIVFSARRVWWMVRYNEFLRYSLVKEALVDKGKLHFRLGQQWFNHPLIQFVVDQWKLVNKK